MDVAKNEQINFNDIFLTPKFAKRLTKTDSFDCQMMSNDVKWCQIVKCIKICPIVGQMFANFCEEAPYTCTFSRGQRRAAWSSENYRNAPPGRSRETRGAFGNCKHTDAICAEIRLEKKNPMLAAWSITNYSSRFAGFRLRLDSIEVYVGIT